MRDAFAVLAALAGTAPGLMHAPGQATAQPAELRRTHSSGLSMGPHAVGFNVIALPGGAGRLFVWRPITRAGSPLTLGAFAEIVCPGHAEDLVECFPNLGAGAGANATSSALRHLELRASPGGRPERGRHRLVLILGSLDSRGSELLGVAEALASQGHVVAEVVPAPQAVDRRIDVRTAEHTADLAALAVARLEDAGGVDTSRIGIVAWSFGGVPAVIRAARDPRVVALVSFDSALRYAYGTTLLGAAGIAPARVRARVYSVAAGAQNPVAKDERFIDALPHVVPRTVGTGLRHADFCDQYGAWAAHASGPDGRDFQQRYRAAVEPAITFLNRALAR